MGCSTDYSWDREEYWQMDVDDFAMSIYLAPTLYGERRLSAKGPYRPVLHLPTDCSNNSASLDKIEVIIGKKEVQTLAVRAFSITVKQYEPKKCLVTFLGDIQLELDFASEKNLEFEVNYTLGESHEAYLRVEARHSSGTTRIPWFTA